ncbi:Smr/MutS family protein [Acuticoccus sp.]|uniref:Smr/MutS family protein n=1 Tax=Acuticoccus sp. TaxID=1904378 RepID=UPI003B519897
MRRRPLREEERALWEKVARTVAPLRQAASLPAIEAAAEAPMAPEAATAASDPPVQPVAAKRPVRARTVGDLDRKTRRKVARGGVAIDGRLDLHGLTQEEAHAALRRFLAASTDLDRRLVLVITGKGQGEAEGRGILRRSVPHWLAARDLARHVVGFGPAHPSHGGDGALYVRLRAKRRGSA